MKNHTHPHFSPGALAFSAPWPVSSSKRGSEVLDPHFLPVSIQMPASLWGLKSKIANLQHSLQPLLWSAVLCGTYKHLTWYIYLYIICLPTPVPPQSRCLMCICWVSKWKTYAVLVHLKGSASCPQSLILEDLVGILITQVCVVSENMGSLQPMCQLWSTENFCWFLIALITLILHEVVSLPTFACLENTG